MPVTINGRAFTNLVSRSASYKFLGSLPPEAQLQMVQAKVTHAVTDSTVTLNWDRKRKLEPQAVIAAFEFLDKQVADGEWQLRFYQLYFATGKAFLKWQVDTSTRIESSQVSQ